MNEKDWRDEKPQGRRIQAAEVAKPLVRPQVPMRFSAKAVVVGTLTRQILTDMLRDVPADAVVAIMSVGGTHKIEASW